MIKESDNIEFRSEKVRNIIGQIPKKIIRIGISIIFVVFFSLMSFAYFFQFEYNVEGICKKKKKNETIYYNIKVPYYESERIKPNQKIMLSIVNNSITNNIETTVQMIDLSIYITNSENFIKIYGSFINSEIVLMENIEINAFIKTGKTNIFNLVLNRIKN